MTSGAADSSRWQLERFELVGAGGRPIRGEARVVAGATASVVLLHGFKGFTRFSFFPHLAERLAGIGCTVISFNFSGSGIGDDMENFTDAKAFESNSFGKELYDLVIVNAEATRRAWLGERRGLFGHSRGGGVAVLHAARDERVSALATWAGISTVNRWTNEAMATWRERGYLDVPNSRTGQVLRVGTGMLDEIQKHGDGRLDIERAAALVRCPWLIVHGESDETVSIDEAERLSAATRHRAELVRIPGANHVFNVAHGMTRPSPELQVALDRTVTFFDTELRARP